MRLRDWKPDNWDRESRKLASETRFDSYELVEFIRIYLMESLEKKSIKLQHSCNPFLTGLEVKDPTIVIEPPMYLINLGEPT